MPDASYTIDADFPGGNITVDRTEGDTAFIRPDLRDTEGNWFYWCFRVGSAQGRTIRFEFTQQSPIGARGPAISLDNGLTWRWLGREKGTTDSLFTHTFGPADREVIFGLGMTYTQQHLDRFMANLPGRAKLSERVLCATRKGRPVHAFTFGDPSSARHRIILTARHHCCEMMANYELEGLIASMTADDAPGRWFQQNVAAFIVPFVDKDGVEDGDQGKNRRPRDHNRDYDGTSAHVETAALREQLPQWLAGHSPDVFMDLHCPWIRGGINEITYQVGSPSPENWEQQQRFGASMEKHCTSSIPYRASNDLPFGKDWNVAANGTAGLSSTRWGRDVLNARLSTTIEFPYANSSGAEVNPESGRAFGTNLAQSLQAYLQADKSNAPRIAAMRTLVAITVAALLSCAPLAGQEQKTPADYRLSKVRLLPAPGKLDALAGARLTGSNLNATNGFVEIAPVPKPSADGWLEIPISTAQVYRFVKIEAGDARLSLAEIEFHTPSGKLSGKPFGTADKSNPKLFERAMDGDPATSFDAPIDHAYVGLELPGEAQTQNVIFEPAGGAFEKPVTLKLRTWPSGPAIRYTADGSTPSRENGQAYSSPIQIDKTTSVAAFAHQDGRADSRLGVVTYVIGTAGEVPPLVESYHIGNSLTDTTKGSFDVIARSAGQNLTTYYKTIPGCSIKGNWENNAAGFGYPDAWCNDYYKVSGMKLEHLFQQPFPNPPGLYRDGEFGAKFIRLARESNPDVQPWLYAQWVAYPGIDATGKVTAAYCDQIGGQSWDKEEPEAWMPPIPKAQVKSWDDAMANAGDYYRAILKRWNALAPGNKPVRLVPADKALLALEAAIKAGKLPGVSDFGEFTFSDGLHLTPAGAYLVSLTHYACVFGESPQGKVTWATSRLSAEQAKVLQQLAWQTVIADPDSGVKP